jgi:hypothetical protein
MAAGASRRASSRTRSSGPNNGRNVTEARVATRFNARVSAPPPDWTPSAPIRSAAAGSAMTMSSGEP